MQAPCRAGPRGHGRLARNLLWRSNSRATLGAGAGTQPAGGLGMQEACHGRGRAIVLLTMFSRCGKLNAL